MFLQEIKINYSDLFCFWVFVACGRWGWTKNKAGEDEKHFLFVCLFLSLLFFTWPQIDNLYPIFNLACCVYRCLYFKVVCLWYIEEKTLGKSFRHGSQASHTLPADFFFHSKMWRLFHAVVLASFLTCCFAASNGTIPAVLWHGMGE